MKLLIKVFLEPFRMVGDFFTNDAHSIVSKRGYRIIYGQEDE